MEECAEIIAHAHGDDTKGACWAVLIKWWEWILFGFYPPENYWRPTVAFVLLLVALVPALFRPLPRKLLLVSAFYPIIAYY
jgi:general L-amino acid transport system permease protein